MQQQQHKFVAAVPVQQVGIADERAHALDETNQHHVAAGMAEGIIDAFEVVEVGDQ